MSNKNVVLFSLAALLVAAAMGIRSLAQPANPAPYANPTNAMFGYYVANRKAILSGTAATNLTEAEVSHLLNVSIKTNLAAQLWFRKTMQGGLSSQGAKMAGELRILEVLRDGRTEDAIRDLEDSLDRNIIFLAVQLRAADQIKEFEPTPQSRTALQWAREYRQKFPYKSGNSTNDDLVADAFSYLDKK